MSSPSLTRTQAAALDDDEGLADFTQWLNAEDGGRERGQGGSHQGRLGRSRWLLSGLHCAACAGLIEQALSAVPGVVSAEVSGAAQRAVVVWDPAVTRPSEMVAAVQAAGYGAYPDTGAEAVALALRESRTVLWRLFVAGFCMMQVMMYATPAYVAGEGTLGADMAQLLRWASWVLTIPVMLFAAGPYLRGAWRSLLQRRIGMDVPVALGLVVTFIASSAATFSAEPGNEVYFDSLTMFVAFLLTARWLEARARRRAAQALDAVMRQLPDAVERLDADGQATLVRTARLRVGDRVRVQVGQAFVADGQVLAGRTMVDESMLTGESLPVPRGVGDAVSAGCLNLGAPVEVVVQVLGAQTRYQRIVALVEQALTQRPAFVQATDRLAGPFLWGVLALAGAGWLAWQFIDPARATWVAVSVLIVTCPCALSLGAPVALLTAAGDLARRGVLVQRLDALEVLTRARHWVFDKTGTLTEDRLGVAQVVSLCGGIEMDGLPADVTVGGAAGSLATQSAHPLSRALAEHVRAPATIAWTEVREVAGQGVQAVAWGRCWRLGGAAWCGLGSVADGPLRPSVWFAVAEPTAEGVIWRPLARFEFDETVRADATAAMAALRDAGLTLHLFSGDQSGSVAALARRLHIGRYRAACTPDDKLAAVAALQQAGDPVVMVGDGINDAPVLARADVSVALGSAAALAQARSDVIVLGNRLQGLVELRQMALRTLRIVRQNLAWAVAYNVACVPLALLGWLPPWLAGIGMAGSSLAVVLNALRLARRPLADKPVTPIGRTPNGQQATA